MTTKLPPYKNSFIKLTVKRAKEFLAANRFPGQRNQNEDRTRVHVKKIESGKFHTGQVAIAHNGRQDYLMNGQHICMAVVQTGKTVDCWLMEWMNCTKAQLPLIYSQYDDGGNRTPGDVAWAYCTAAGLDPDTPQAAVRLCASALWILQVQKFGRSGRHTKEERAGHAAQHLHEIRWITKLMYSNRKNIYKAAAHLRRAQVIAAAIACFQKNKSDANTFWTDVRDGAGLASDDEAKVLRDWLRNISRVRNVNQVRVAKGPITTAHEVYTRCIFRWNSYRTGDPAPRYAGGFELPEAI